MQTDDDTLLQAGSDIAFGGCMMRRERGELCALLHCLSAFASMFDRSRNARCGEGQSRGVAGWVFTKPAAPG